MSFDMEGVTGSVLLLCLMSIMNLTNANTSPSINENVYQVCEDTDIGELAFTIDATDRENDTLSFFIDGPNAGYFRVERNTGRVFVERTLDREISNVMPLDAEVSDGPNTVTRLLTIILKDANDNKPIFDPPSYDYEIAENAAINTTLFTARATDRDTGSAGIVLYSITEASPTSGLSLFSIVNTTGEVKLVGSLNYTQQQFYQLKIRASDGGGQCDSSKPPQFHSSTALSFITVKDVPDLDPVFVGAPYIGSVEENSAMGHSVLKVTARDQDTQVNDKMIYSIEESTPDGLFTISEEEGIISVSSAIDREVIGDTVTMTIKATESNPNIHGERASTTAAVQINIIDVNDNTPMFYKCGDSGDCVNATHFTGEVFEHSLGSISLNMTVKDLDRISRAQLILEGADKDVFSVEPAFITADSVVQLLVRQPEKLDYEETDRMVLEVIAIDEGEPSFRSTATVTINIKDSNDHSPKFPQDTYKLNVTENSPVGTVIATITAEDPDTMDQGNITYKLLPDSMLLYFDVEPDTGKVYVKNETLLDREARSLYSVTLQARDTDDKPGSTVLEITVTDVNDEPPVINRNSYLEFVKEGGQLELKIEATDADEPNTVNSQIVFAILPSEYSDNFTIDPNTGVLRNKGELDREALDPKLDGKIELNVTATDKGTPPLSTMVPVIINVEDVNDNTPQFGESSYTFSVKEAHKGEYVGSVFAEDLDQTVDFNRISFSIIDGNFGSFIIRTFAEGSGYWGNITVDPDIVLDYEGSRRQFKLRVEATDLEDKKAYAMVEVNVMDINDERPEFKSTVTVEVKENTNSTEAVGNFTGYDKDGNHSLVYELESMKCRCNGTFTPCSSFILEPSGQVKINPESTVDYEQCNQVVIQAQVVDEFTEQGENNSVSTGEMIINILDVNDNAPEFIYSDSIFVVVSESTSEGTSVAGVTATDRDTDINRQIEFEVTHVQFEDINNPTRTVKKFLFEAVTTQQKDIYVGIIQTTDELDKKLKGKYLVTVLATDSGGLFNSTVVEIFTVDETYKIELEFTSTPEEVEANRNEIIRALTTATKASVKILRIRAYSPDEEARNSVQSIVETYFVYTNGTALTFSEVVGMLGHPDHNVVLAQLGLANIGAGPVIETEIDTFKFVLMGMVAGLVIVLTVLTTSLMCTRRNYRRKLKAAKAMNSASMVNYDNQKSGPVVPGTNKYTMEGANPVLNLNINGALVLDLDEESSDVDKVSLNSLDDHYEPDNEKSMQMIQEEEEEEEEDGPPEYIEPLGAALAQRGQKRSSNNPLMSFNNPAFDTTDL